MAETTIEGLAQTLTKQRSDHLLGPLHSCPTRSPTILVSPKPRISRTRPPLSLQYPPKPTSSLSPPRPLLGFSTPFSPSSRSTSTVLLATPESQLSLGDSPETREWDMQDFYLLRKDVETTSKRVEEVRASSSLELLEEEVRRLETAAADDSFWDDRTRAQQILMALNDVKDKIKLLTEIKTQVEDAETIVNLTEEMDSIDGALLQEAVSLVKELNKVLDRFELTQLLSGPYDKEGAVLYITAGAGGTDAQDWADMVLRMYVRWGEKQRYKTKVVEMSSGEEAGIKSATVEIEGRYAYGYLSGEKGTHRIVRQSPFNAKGLRQTSFSGVEIMPLLPDESMAVEIPEEDLDISFSRAGGKGGQNVNKVETAVRITHIPTGVTVRCTVAWWHGYTVSHLIKTVGIIYMCSYGLFPAENCGGDQLFVEVYQTRELVEGRTFNSW
ncbi:peptide chain release factor PrfB1, chloroplastic isoform X2 [Rhododendron vialii]|uniref:peptide chain release factor PrfB1, chloroplastic isoform X2 n=1 Tax=Rhododendron vialii TaxID=182163 RepID=UPI00265F9BD5|nr:peptide chain release factor PrfB1, chloroplastic isoform X2 [Rhododendron vialii]